MAECSLELAKQGKSYPRTCAVHGLFGCDRNINEIDTFLHKYREAKGQTQREMLVEQLRSEDTNLIHRLIEKAL